MTHRHNTKPAYSSLKSDQNGIEIFENEVIDMLSEQLKSDQNGIEITDVEFLVAASYMLKSDQNGIEITEENVGYFHRPQVKIRPKWDWNHHIRVCNVILWFVKIRPKWDWNQERLIRLRLPQEVKIRPKWDWNCRLWGSSLVRGLPWLKSDQNGIEIIVHVRFDWGFEAVKIRPKWDWNVFLLFLFSPWYHVKIRPKWDWNTKLGTVSYPFPPR